MRRSFTRVGRSRWTIRKGLISCRLFTTTGRDSSASTARPSRLPSGRNTAMLGGYYDEHPWGTFEAPMIVEDPGFPGMAQWPRSFTIKDEIYQIKDYSRENCRVLMRLDASKLDLHNPRV